jgi:hypothetical protein
VIFTPTLLGGSATIADDTTGGIQWLNGNTWQSASGGVSIPSGSGEALLRVAINNDPLYEGVETFQFATGAVNGVRNSAGVIATVTLVDNGSSTNSFLATNTTRFPTVGLADNDSRPIGTLSVEAIANGSETGPTPSLFRIRRTGDPAAALVFTYELSGTATPGSDYTTPAGFSRSTGSGSLSFAPGQASIDLSTASLDDNVVDGARSINLRITAPDRYTLAAGSATVTIADNDVSTPTLPVITALSTAVGEPDSGSRAVPVTLRLSAPASSPITVGYRTTSAGSTATAGADYIAISDTTLTIPSGNTSWTFSVTVKGDNTPEPNETIRLEFFNPIGATFTDSLTTSTSTITILDNDTSTALNQNVFSATLPWALYGNSLGDILSGGGGDDILAGDPAGTTLGGADVLTGNGGADVLTGGPGADWFRYPLFTDSTLTNLDTIADFQFGALAGDRLAVPVLPSSLWSRGWVKANLQASDAVISAFADKDTMAAGEQPLITGEAVIFGIGANVASRQWYVAINAGNAGFSATEDLLIRLTGNQPAFLSQGKLEVSHLFAAL